MPRWYRADQGGHAPGFLREALIISVERAEAKDVAHWSDALADEAVLSHCDRDFQSSWERWPVKRRAGWLLGQLHNCTDIMSAILCDQLQLPHGSAFARGARKLRDELETVQTSRV
jgi:hypothetical protein